MGERTYKLIALDMDGTLLNEEKEISAANAEWLAKAQEAGMIVMFATGRGYQSALPYARQLGLEQSPMVLVNGSEIWRTASELHRREQMPVEWVRELRRMALEQDVWYWAYAVEGIFNRENWPEEAAIDRMGWLKFGYYTENEGKLPIIRRTLEGWDKFEITNSHPCNLELNPRGITKASGVREVCRLLGIGLDEVIAMGDSLNDIAMIREAGLGVAMGNAQDEVKEVADAVTSSNDDDGVARIIRERVFGIGV